jgi:hypothetical protein
MKKGFVVLALIMVLGLVGCSSTPAEETNTAEPSAGTPTPLPTEKNAEEIVTEEKWQEVAFDNGVTLRFEKDGSGSYVSNGFTFDSKWSIDGEELTMKFTLEGEEKTLICTLVQENSMFLLKSGVSIFSQVSDYEKAVEIYKIEDVKEVAYFEECTTLPTIDSCVDVFASGNSTSTLNGAITKIEYRYNQADEADFKEYIDYLTQNGFTVKEIEADKYEIIENETKYIVANVFLNGDTITMDIIPSEKRELSSENNTNPATEPAPIAISIKELKYNRAGTPELYLQFTNESDKDLVAFDFYVRCYDAYGEIVKGYNRYDVFSGIYDEVLKAGTTSPNGYYYDLFGFDLAKNVEVAVTRYKIDGENAVDIPENQLVWVSMK